MEWFDSGLIKSLQNQGCRQIGEAVQSCFNCSLLWVFVFSENHTETVVELQCEI